MGSKGRWIAVVVFLACSTAVLASDPALVRIERRGPGDRALLIAEGIPLFGEMGSSFLAMGEMEPLASRLESLGYGYSILDANVTGWSYSIAGLRAGFSDAAQSLASCGEAIWTEDNWVLVRSFEPLSELCLESDRWFIRPLPATPMSAPLPPPAEYAHLQEGPVGPLAAKPLVQTMVNAVSSSFLSYCWDDIISSATTRYSTSAGCTSATDAVYNTFSGLGIPAARQSYRSGYAPNVVGTITGKTTPQNVYIIIGHIDDMPSSGLAPGADDNASGSAAVTAAAQAMANYAFASTVKFIACTGEEQGLYGSTYYANDAHARGEGIQGVLNGDMIAWAGDGLPSSGEDLDLDYNSTSLWLSALFAQCATDYSTGLPVKQLLCPSLTASDHAPFWDNGYSAVCGITDNEGYCNAQGHYPYYHTSNDTKTNCGSTVFFLKAVRTYVATLAHLADPLCAKPGSPAIVSATVPGDNQIVVSWTPGNPAGTTYNIYRSTGACPGSSYSLVKTGQASSPWTDTTVSGGVTYSYKVASVDSTAYCESVLSACVSATATGPCTAAPSFAGVSGVVCPNSATCTLNVSWGAATPLCSGPATYSVYRSTAAPFTPTPENRVASGLTATTYSDAVGLENGTTYHYIVRAVDSSNGAEDGNTVTRSGIPMGTLVSGTWLDDGGDTGTAKMTLASPWSITTTGGRAGTKGYQTGTYTANLCAALTTPTLNVASGATLTFWSHYDIESNWDKGQLEASTDGGGTWDRLTVTTYPMTVTNTGDACAFPSGRAYFSGTNATWASYTASVPSGAAVQIRWNLSSDSYIEGSGWWIDDITITNVQVPGTCTTGAALPPGEAAPGNMLATAQTWSNLQTQEWPPVPGATGYVLYRGVLADLPHLMTGAVDSCVKYQGAATSTGTLTENPAGIAGNFYWYLVTASNAFGEGPAGPGSGGPRIVNASGPCPP
jgi:hypothetical protein